MFGVVLILVSLLTLMLIGQLLISQARSEIQLLHHLGFADSFLSRCYVKVMLPVIGLPFVLAGSAVFAAGFALQDVLAYFGQHPAQRNAFQGSQSTPHLRPGCIQATSTTRILPRHDRSGESIAGSKRGRFRGSTAATG